MTISQRASASNPCPVCRAGSKGCSVTDTGLSLCRGVGPGESVPDGWRETRSASDDAGFRHFQRKGDPPPRSRPVKPTNPHPPKDWGAEAEQYAGRMTDDSKARLATTLLLPVEALAALPLIGVTNATAPDAAFTFPESDAAGTVIGINRRMADGSKRMIKGGNRGLTIPDGWRERPGPVYVVEGPSDTLAMAAAGFAVVGRPSNAGGAALLGKLLNGERREIVVLGENDEKETGDWPGRDGAETVARRLSETLHLPVSAVLPLDMAKDVRAWLTDDARSSMPWTERGEVLRKALHDIAATKPAEPVRTESDRSVDDEEKGKAPAAANILIEIGLTAELFHDKAGEAYATFTGRTAKVRSRLFRSWLAARYFEGTGKGAHGEAMTTAIATLEATAVHGGPEQAVHVRLAGHDGAVYLNLADDDGKVIIIDAQGWRVDPTPPVRFLTTANAGPLPMPEMGGRIEDLRRVVNCPDDDNFALLVGWVSVCFLANGPFPVLILTGEQGTAKSTTGRVLKQLIDPERVRDRAAPKDLRDLAIWASGCRLLSVDNVSGFPDWLSDGFCRITNGGGFGTRKLYENDEEMVFEARRPAILNGIEDFVKRDDLLERSIILRHPPITKLRRRLESDLWREFETLKPKLLGAILDRVAAGLKALPDVDKSNMPRMADAAAFAVACEQGMGEPARFLEAFDQNQSESNEMSIADSPVAEPIRTLVVNSGGTWSGTATELYAAIKPPGEKLPPGWPKKPSGLTGALRRLSPAMSKCYGLVMSNERATTSDRKRIVRLELDPDNSRKPSSVPSDPVRPTPGPRTPPDDPDAASRKLSGTDLSALFK